MKYSTILLISIGLAMDAFIVAICKGMSMKKLSFKKSIIIGTYFGIFQALMPIVGYLLGYRFEYLVKSISHIIACMMLSLIGANIIFETIKSNLINYDDSTDFKTMIQLALATSIDALTIGITFSFLSTEIYKLSIIIGITTFFLCVCGVKIGFKFGNIYEKKARFNWWCYINFNGNKNFV